MLVIPAKAGIQFLLRGPSSRALDERLDPGFRRDDERSAHAAMHQDGARPLSLGATWEFAINRLGGQSVGAAHNVMNS
jgi:hypothetical protein